jgi:hypothetical protein
LWFGVDPPWSLQFPMPGWLVPQPLRWAHGVPARVAAPQWSSQRATPQRGQGAGSAFMASNRAVARHGVDVDQRCLRRKLSHTPGRFGGGPAVACVTGSSTTSKGRSPRPSNEYMRREAPVSFTGCWVVATLPAQRR